MITAPRAPIHGDVSLHSRKSLPLQVFAVFKIELRRRPGRFDFGDLGREPNAIKVAFDGGRICHCSDDPHSTTTLRTGLHVQLERPRQQRCPEYPIFARSPCLAKLFFPRFSWNYLVSVLCVRREDTVVSNEIHTRRGHQCRQLFYQLHRREDEVCRSVTPWRL